MHDNECNAQTFREMKSSKTKQNYKEMYDQKFQPDELKYKKKIPNSQSRNGDGGE